MSTKKTKLTKSFGILGGGQLSMMLAQKAQTIGLLPQILTPSKNDPAARVSGQIFEGDSKNPVDLKRFTETLDVLTFESEFYDGDYLKENLPAHLEVFPKIETLKLLQDRKTQKEAFEKSKLQTSPFICVKEKEKVQSFFKVHKSLVAKKRWNGYDGYGTYVLKNQSALNQFLNENQNSLQDFIFEKLIPFQYEIAVQAARSRSGHVVFFPFVKTTQKDNKCFLVEGPEKSNTKLQKAIEKFLNKIDYVGVIGLEFFKTPTQLILNEVAPRVHNTGHHTLDSCDTDQFTMHWLCATQDKLPKPRLKSKASVMLNLVGTGTHEIEIPPRQEGALTWYGKSNRPGRKLGHINFTGENKKALVKRALSELKRWKL